MYIYMCVYEQIRVYIGDFKMALGTIKAKSLVMPGAKVIINFMKSI
jgi:hypothetical protein